ncbi:hypothetical protein FOCC_FOCC014148 [Frankliniella occidentalis]|nr:hypothetical protein FOCC_FOCC014148 [Frankliniella occidentalis]
MSGQKEKVVKKRNALTVTEKVNIIKMLEGGATLQQVATRTERHVEHIRKISKAENAVKLQQFSDKTKDKTRCKMREPLQPEHDADVHSWLLQLRSQGIVVTDALIQEQARELSGLSTFQASNGWLNRFRKRHGLRQLPFQGERAAADEKRTTEYIGELMEMLYAEEYDLEDIYNMDETGCCWKSLPRKTVVHAGEKRADGGKVKKDRFTAAMCANAAGTHQLPLLVIDVESEVYGNLLRFKISDRIEVVFLPPNTTSLIQPMDQGVIVKTKRLFQGKLLRRVLKCPGGLVEFYKNYTIRDAIEMLAESWKELTPANLTNAWRKLLPTFFEDDNEEPAPVTVEVPTVADLANIGKYPESAVKEWLDELDEAEEETTGQEIETVEPVQPVNDNDIDLVAMKVSFENVEKYCKGQNLDLQLKFQQIYEHFQNNLQL